MKLTIIMPAFNERDTIREAVAAVLSAPRLCAVELVVVDDASTDGTTALLDQLPPRSDVRVVAHARNRGKGAAIRTGMRYATGDYVLIFDADLEYDAADIPMMVEPVVSGRAHYVFGVRQFAGATSYGFRYMLANRLMTMTTNVLFDCWIGDLHTCLKLMPTEFLRDMDPVERGFGLDTEITARALRLGVRPFEVPVQYRPRSHAEGKKIGWRDGVACLNILRRERLRRADADLLAAVRDTYGTPRRGHIVLPDARSNVIDLQAKAHLSGLDSDRDRPDHAYGVPESRG
jgi:dolichol-phosphate hexosyltransferase